MDQKKLIERVKSKTEYESLSINSQIYFIGDTAVFTASDMIRRQSSLTLAWFEGDRLVTKALYDSQTLVTINRIIAKREKEAMLAMLSDDTIVVISAKDPKGLPAQVIKQQEKK